MKLSRRSIVSFLLAILIAISGSAFTLSQTSPTVTAEAATAKISKKKKTVYVGKSFTLKVKNSKKNYIWKSSNSKVAMVISGGGNTAVIGGMKPGKATVSATYNNKTYKCKVTVKALPEEKNDDDKAGKDSGKNDKESPDADKNSQGKTENNTDKDSQQKDSDNNDKDSQQKTGDGSDPQNVVVPTLDDELNSDTYGLLHAHRKGDYLPRTEYSGISTEDDLLKTMMEGVLSGTRGIVVNYSSMTYNYWKTKYTDLINMSEMNNTANEFYIEPDGSSSFAIFPIYKAGWFALTYYKYVKPGMDEDLRDYITPDENTLKILRMAHEIAEDAIKAHPGDEKEILKYVNDKICDLTTYPKPVPEGKSDPARDIMGVFINHSAVCEGYTAAMQLILNILGFENHTVKNKIDNHIWNRVKVGGTWYHIDATWNDQQNTDGSYKDAWFMLTDEEIDKKNGSDTAHAWKRLKFVD